MAGVVERERRAEEEEEDGRMVCVPRIRDRQAVERTRRGARAAAVRIMVTDDVADVVTEGRRELKLFRRRPR
jgi:hypothetical protein